MSKEESSVFKFDGVAAAATAAATEGAGADAAAAGDDGEWEDADADDDDDDDAPSATFTRNLKKAAKLAGRLDKAMSAGKPGSRKRTGKVLDALDALEEFLEAGMAGADIDEGFGGDEREGESRAHALLGAAGLDGSGGAAPKLIALLGAEEELEVLQAATDVLDAMNAEGALVSTAEACRAAAAPLLQAALALLRGYWGEGGAALAEARAAVAAASAAGGSGKAPKAALRDSARRALCGAMLLGNVAETGMGAAECDRGLAGEAQQLMVREGGWVAAAMLALLDAENAPIEMTQRVAAAAAVTHAAAGSLGGANREALKAANGVDALLVFAGEVAGAVTKAKGGGGGGGGGRRPKKGEVDLDDAVACADDTAGALGELLLATTAAAAEGGAAAPAGGAEQLAGVLGLAVPLLTEAAERAAAAAGAEDDDDDSEDDEDDDDDDAENILANLAFCVAAFCAGEATDAKLVALLASVDGASGKCAAEALARGACALMRFVLEDAAAGAVEESDSDSDDGGGDGAVAAAAEKPPPGPEAAWDALDDAGAYHCQRALRAVQRLAAVQPKAQTWLRVVAGGDKLAEYITKAVPTQFLFAVEAGGEDEEMD